MTGQEQCLYDELYTSDAWNEAHDALQKQRCNDGCKLERVIAGLMFWSDATHLTQFGSASTWPVYLFFGNQSKYLHTCSFLTASMYYHQFHIQVLEEEELRQYPYTLQMRANSWSV